MKVLLVNGSPHQEGNTYVALTEIAKTLEQESIGSEIVWIGTKPVRGCIGCGQCSAKALKACVFDDDVCNFISAKFDEADGFVFASPVYYGQPNGALLAVMQRAFYSNGAAAQNKPGAAVTVCRRGGATAAYQSLLMPMEMSNMPIVSSQYWNIAYGRTPGEASQDTEGMQTMRTLAHNMVWLLKSLQGHPTPAREPKTPMHFIR